MPSDAILAVGRVLLLPPTTRDAEAISSLLSAHAIPCAVFSSLSSLTAAVGDDTGAVLVSEEALTRDAEALVARVQRQPVWSDLPIIVLARAGPESSALTATLPSLGNVSVLERPARVTTLLSVVRSALRARLRQLQVRDHVAELSRATETIRAGEERFRLLVGNVKDYAIFMTDVAGIVTSWNSGAEHILGYSAAEVLGQHAAIFFTAEDRAAGIPQREMTVAESDGRASDVRWHLRKGGERFFVDGVMTAIRDGAGTLIGFSKLMRDVTERKRAEEALAESEAKFKQLANTIPQLAWMAAPDGNIFWYNDRWYEYTGTTLQQMEGWGWQNVHDPEQLPAVVERWQASLSSGTPFEMEFPIKGADGTFRAFLTRVVPLSGADGQISLWFGTNTNVDELRRTRDRLSAAEAAAAKNLAHLQAVVGSMVEGLVTADPDGRLRDWNTAALEMHGFASIEEGRKTLPELPRIFELRELDGTPLPLARWPMARTLAGEAFAGLEYRALRLDMPLERVISYSGTPVRDAAGAISLAVLTLHDVTEKKRVEAERERLLEAERTARAEAEQAGRMKDEFLATLSHELRTPLSAILGWSQILSRGTAKPETLSEGLRTIERNARAQTQIIEDLLDMSRIISGKVALDARPIDVGDVVRAAIETVRQTAVAKGIAVRLATRPEERFPSTGDFNRLQQVFWNLLTNAIKFTPRNGSVTIAVEQRHSLWQIEVTDTGEGIAAEFLPYVFDRFRQADASTTRRHGGLGLGLSIVKQLVELHGGMIRVRSEGLGRGSTFTVSLPVRILYDAAEMAAADRDAAASAIVSAPSSEPAAIRDGTLWDSKLCDDIRGRRAVIIDDEADARALLKHLLGECGVDVIVTATADEALAAIQRDRPDVFISDIGMPIVDGYELIKRIRMLPEASGGRTPAIALTAYARAEDRMRAVRAGYQTHVPKPVEPAELITMIASVMRPE